MSKDVLVSNKVYDILKWVAIIVLPALAILVEGVFPLWGIPYAMEISKTLDYVGVFLGSVLLVSNVNYILKSKSKEV